MLWEIQPHTQAKHDILRRYLAAWFPILASHTRIIYVDGFAGPGEYKGGEPGSPIIALTTAAEHQLQPKLSRAEIVFRFIESDGPRFQNLEQKIAATQWPPNFHKACHNDEFANVLGQILDYLEQKDARLAPAFFFIDPFGPTGFPMQLIRRLAAQPQSEVLINFSYNSLNHWFLSDQIKHSACDEVFGCPDWRTFLPLPPPEKERKLAYLYQARLQDAGFRGVLQFRMVNKSNQPQYHLFYGTKHHLGMRVMKNAMWKVDPTGAFAFSDVTDPAQGHLLDKAFDEHCKTQLAEELPKEFKGQVISKPSLEEWVDWRVSPPYLQRHLTAALRKLEETEQMGIVNPTAKTRRRGTYPDYVSIRFL